MDNKSSVSVLAIVGAALILGSVSMVSRSGLQVSVSKPYSQAATIDTRFDVVKDGVINNKDVKYVVNFVQSSSAPKTAFGKIDYNEDGRIDQMDKDFMQNLFAKDLPCPQNKICDLNRDGEFMGSDLTVLTN
jgi:hypothetical protein